MGLEKRCGGWGSQCSGGGIEAGLSNVRLVLELRVSGAEFIPAHAGGIGRGMPHTVEEHHALFRWN